jgi:U4/U6.U5 tri-snRNP-associated protein 1
MNTSHCYDAVKQLDQSHQSKHILSTMTDEVIELSIEETNKLRAELGLKPLRIQTNGDGRSNGGEGGGVPADVPSCANNQEVLELSVQETNKLREKLGLPPLRTNGNNDGGEDSKKDIHMPAENIAARDQAAKRIELARLKREVEQGASSVFGSSTLTSDDDGKTESWAEKMRTHKQKEEKNKNMKKKTKTTDDNDDKSTSRTTPQRYGESDLEGMAVRNNMSTLEAGSSTILTLADSAILEKSVTISNKVVGMNQQEDELENVNLTEQDKQQDGLRKKRMLEMGMGRAGGYAGFDDEEFEELGGTLGPSRRQRGATGTLSDDLEWDESAGRTRAVGFRIGAGDKNNDKDQITDFEKVQHGKAISLETSGDVAGNDYMTREEEETERERKKSKKDAKFKKKKKEKKKKDHNRRRIEMADDDEEEGVNHGAGYVASSLLSQLESTANAEDSSLQKRRKLDTNRTGEDDVMGEEVTTTASALPNKKRTQYERAMEKGNMRTREAFNTTALTKTAQSSFDADEEVDDSFLNAAISKARRLNRLRGMNKGVTGADAVAEAVKSSAFHENSDTNASSSNISFSIDDTREFSRALRARAQQKERDALKSKDNDHNVDAGRTLSSSNTEPTTDSNKHAENDVQVECVTDAEMEDVNMEDLAKQVDDTDDRLSVFEGSTASNAGVGRGLSSFVSMLKTTGEITGKHGGREELRGRAKDERNYDNYQPLDLSKVVVIGKNATDKDIEFANREIKLEYRDKHGRLLTQKEAFRDLCYQFHGHGASKKKEEKRQQQIAREQAEARHASKQVSAARDGDTTGTTLGAMKAAAKATGKAFIVHKT